MNPYVDLCLHVQALRRQAEEARTPLASALGVASSIYTHQLANVLRVLTDVRVRHLLADEVGLGKTVQALMILNALRRQRRNLRALVIVPDNLVGQWRDELMTRAHTTPYETSAPGEGQFVRLAWEDQLSQTNTAGQSKLTLADIDSSQFQLLIVDELHRLRVELQDRIVRVSSDFDHLLVLTATPSFQDPKRHAQLFALLEPERTRRARLDTAGATQDTPDTNDLSHWPESVPQRVVSVLLERDREAAVGANPTEFTDVAMALCAYRRVLRTRRADYSGVVPSRRHCAVVVEPLGAEVDRQTLMWHYFGHLADLSTRFDTVTLAKRVVLSPPSLEQRIDFLRRKGHEREGLLERVKPLVHRGKGDSRADALVDLLAAIWNHAPHERVLVAAQDNLTVDYLFTLVRARLPEIGPLGARVPLVAARVRQGMETEAFEDLGGFGNETSENLEAFQRGAAQILIAPDASKEGLNLQCARVLVLYSVPWRPEEVEQWIGRVDRIGNVAAYSNAGAARTIDVYTIVQRGLVDEKVVGVLQRFNIFERGINLDGMHLAEVTGAIENAALRPHTVNWRELEERTAEMADKDAIVELSSALRTRLPWDRRWASAQRERLDALPPAAPVIDDLPAHSSVGPKAWDRALEPFFRLLNRANEYSFRLNKDSETGTAFWTLWYSFGLPGLYGRRPVLSRVIFPFGADPSTETHPRHSHAFITRRSEIGMPPRRDVILQLGQDKFRRPLHFANFGDALHDELIDGWSSGSAALRAVEVKYFNSHKLWKYALPGWVLVRMSVLDPADALSVSSAIDRVERTLAEAVARSPIEDLPRLVAPFSRAARCALEADARWLRAVLISATTVIARAKVNDAWQDLSSDGVVALLNPMAHPDKGLPSATKIEGIDPTIVAEFDRLRSVERNGGQVWCVEWPSFLAELHARLRVVTEEAADAVFLAQRAVERAEAALADAMVRGNRAQVTRAERNLVAAFDIAALTDVYWDCRAGWLRDCEKKVADLRPQTRLKAAIHARRAVI